MADRFLKFIPSEAAIQFAIKYKNAFVLLMIIAEERVEKMATQTALLSANVISEMQKAME